MKDQVSNRFVILRHIPGEAFERTNETHLDWMFEVKGHLRTFSTAMVSFKDLANPRHLKALELSNHRIEYLEIRGDIGGQRGSVSEVLCGTYNVLAANEDKFFVCLEGTQNAMAFRIHCFFTRVHDEKEMPRRSASWSLKTHPNIAVYRSHS